MKKVNLRYYDSLNLGDDLFVKIILERYKEAFLVNPTGYSKVFHKHQNASPRSSASTIFIRKIIRRILLRKVFALEPGLKKGDLLVYIGGSIFIEKGNLPHWNAERQFYNSLNMPYYILGSNIGPYSSPNFLSIVRGILSGAKDVCLRDKKSFDLVKDIPQARLATDIVFTLDTSHYNISNGNNYIVSVIDASKKFNLQTTEKYNKTIVTIISKLLTDEKSSVTLMSFCKKEGDENACKDIFSMLPEELQSRVSVYRYRGNINEALSTIASCRGIVGSRFHANILGLLFGKKILPIAYSDKTINILKDMNYDGSIIDIREMDSTDIKSIEFSSLKKSALNNLKKEAESHFAELDKILTRE